MKGREREDHLFFALLLFSGNCFSIHWKDFWINKKVKLISFIIWIMTIIIYDHHHKWPSSPWNNEKSESPSSLLQFNSSNRCQRYLLNITMTIITTIIIIFIKQQITEVPALYHHHDIVISAASTSTSSSPPAPLQQKNHIKKYHDQPHERHGHQVSCPRCR